MSGWYDLQQEFHVVVYRGGVRGVCDRIAGVLDSNLRLQVITGGQRAGRHHQVGLPPFIILRTRLLILTF